MMLESDVKSPAPAGAKFMASIGLDPTPIYPKTTVTYVIVERETYLRSPSAHGHGYVWARH